MSDVYKLFNLGNALLANGQYSEALKYYDRAIKLDPRQASIWNNRGFVLEKLNRYSEAIYSYNKAILLNPNQANVWYNKGFSLYMLKSFSEALECYDKAIELEPKNANTWYFRGLVLEGLEKYSKALKSYNLALKFDSNKPDVWYNKGVSLYVLKRFSEALESFDKSIELNPNHPDTWLNKGSVLAKLQRHSEALDCFDRAIELNPNNTDIWHNKAISLDELKRFSEALESFDKSIELNPNHPDTWRIRGFVLLRTNNLSEALESFDKSIELNPDEAITWFGKAIALDQLDRVSEALESYDKSIELDSNIAEFWFMKGNLLGVLEKHSEALESFEKSIELNPNNAINWYSKGVSLEHLGRFSDALECYDMAIEINPTNAIYVQSKGLALANLERFSEALESFDKSIELEPENARSWYCKGICLFKLGCYVDSAESFKKGKQFFAYLSDKSESDKCEAHELWAKGWESWSFGNHQKTMDYLKRAESIFRSLKEDQLSNSLELIFEIIPLDQEFIEALKSENLTQLRERTNNIVHKLKIIKEKIDETELIEDVLEIFNAKSYCFNALYRSVRSLEPINEELSSAREIFEKRSFEKSLLALNSLENFIKIVKKFDNVQKIPEDVELKLLQILHNSIFLDGCLTREISMGQFISSKWKKKIEEPSVIPVNIGERNKDIVRVCLVQLNYLLRPASKAEEFGYYLRKKEEVKKKVFEALDLAQKHKVDIICFPEFSTSQDWVKKIKKKYKKIIVIFGTHYRDRFNECPIIIDGTDYYSQKINPSPNFEEESEAGRGMLKGNSIYVFQTRVGTFVVFICLDYLKESYRVLKKKANGTNNLDFIFVPQYNDAVERFQDSANVDCHDDGCPYIIQVNGWNIRGKDVGNSSVIGLEHKNALDRYQSDGYVKNNKVKYKLVEASKPNQVLIVDVDLKSKGIIVPAQGLKLKKIISLSLNS